MEYLKRRSVFDWNLLVVQSCASFSFVFAFVKWSKYPFIAGPFNAVNAF